MWGHEFCNTSLCLRSPHNSHILLGISCRRIHHIPCIYSKMSPRLHIAHMTGKLLLLPGDKGAHRNLHCSRKLHNGNRSPGQLTSCISRILESLGNVCANILALDYNLSLASLFLLILVLLVGIDYHLYIYIYIYIIHTTCFITTFPWCSWSVFIIFRY